MQTSEPKNQSLLKRGYLMTFIRCCSWFCSFPNYLNFYSTIRIAQLTCCYWLNFEHQYVSGGICYFHSVTTLLYVKLAL